jgi:flagellar biosynthesis/type III secretory pathway protein FliH
MATRLPGIFMLLRELAERETALEYLYTLLRYVSQAAASINQETLSRAVQTAFPARGGELMETLAKEWMEQGIQQGTQQGFQQGREEGLQQGLRQGLLAAVELGLELRFGVEGLRLLPEIYKLDDVDLLRAIHEGLKRVQTLDELQRIYQ